MALRRMNSKHTRDEGDPRKKTQKRVYRFRGASEIGVEKCVAVFRQTLPQGRGYTKLRDIYNHLNARAKIFPWLAGGCFSCRYMRDVWLIFYVKNIKKS